MAPLSHRSAAAAAATRTVLLPEVLDLGDIAYWLRCPKSFALKLLQDGSIPHRRIGRSWLVTRGEFLQFLESRKAANTAAPLPLRVVPSDETAS